MNVLIISQSTGTAINQTTRIIDLFAERYGDGAWQTTISQAGLDMLYKLLRKSVKKNTSVACHWIKKSGRTELLWIIGSRKHFNDTGAVPTNISDRNILRADDENTWRSLPLIRILVGLAALFHDIGKANKQFQRRLGPQPSTRSYMRHEWISLCFFAAFVSEHCPQTASPDDTPWLRKLMTLNATTAATWHTSLTNIHKSPTHTPLQSLPPLAKAIAWLIVTHHRLPSPPKKKGTISEKIFAIDLKNVLNEIQAQWNQPFPDPAPSQKEKEEYWSLNGDLPWQSEIWQERVNALAKGALKFSQEEKAACINDPFVMHLSRLCLTMADHAFSPLPSTQTAKSSNALYANTKDGQRDQLLEEHLLGVEKYGRKAIETLPRITDELPRLAMHKTFRKSVKTGKYHWQNKAGDMAASVRERSMEQGAFIVNMASTGCGKTLGNARIMHNLADESKGMRCAFALGLRTLTRQTGREFRSQLALGGEDVAILEGGTATRVLFDKKSATPKPIPIEIDEPETDRESASPDMFLPEDSYVRYEGNLNALKGLDQQLADSRVRGLLLAPILVCTIDHLAPATECLRGGHQIPPMLRLLSGDLVLDELDDYDISDLHAVTRLVYWAGILGSRVLISSATLPPALVSGMFMAYKKGREIFKNNRGTATPHAQGICCLWVDEFNTIANDCDNEQSFSETHALFVNKRCSKLEKSPKLRHGSIVEINKSTGADDDELIESFTSTIMQTALTLHKTNCIEDPNKTGKRVSFGLTRMANIGPLYQVALKMFELGAPEGVRIHLCVYHSRFPLLLRSDIEHRLDTVLNRKAIESTPNTDPIFDHSDVRTYIDAHPETEHIFLVLASPVAEVGRDHDYDWVIIEPSSMRSIIQIAGRLRRHRPAPWDKVNIALLHTNLLALKQPTKRAFCQPGFELESVFKFKTHDLHDLLTPQEYIHIDATPRILTREILAPTTSMVDLEHCRINDIMTSKSNNSVGAYSCWEISQSMLSGRLQRQFPFRKQTQPQTDVWLRPDASGNNYTLHELQRTPGSKIPEDVPVEHKNYRIDTQKCTGTRITPWGTTDYMQSLQTLAHDMGMDLESCARRFSLVTLPTSKNNDGWFSNPFLGFSPFSPT